MLKNFWNVLIGITVLSIAMFVVIAVMVVSVVVTMPLVAIYALMEPFKPGYRYD